MGKPLNPKPETPNPTNRGLDILPWEVPKVIGCALPGMTFNARCRHSSFKLRVWGFFGFGFGA